MLAGAYCAITFILGCLCGAPPGPAEGQRCIGASHAAPLPPVRAACNGIACAWLRAVCDACTHPPTRPPTLRPSHCCANCSQQRRRHAGWHPSGAGRGIDGRQSLWSAVFAGHTGVCMCAFALSGHAGTRVAGAGRGRHQPAGVAHGSAAHARGLVAAPGALPARRPACLPTHGVDLNPLPCCVVSLSSLAACSRVCRNHA